MSCRNPFNTLYILPDGYTTCCQSWLTPEVPIFHVDHLSPWQIWNHKNFVELRRRVLAENFHTCQRCPRFQNAAVPEETDRDMQPIMKRGPLRVIITNDLVCNLACWSCRPKAIGRNKNVERVQKRRMVSLLNTFKKDLRTVQLLQSGEVFASPIHMEWLKSINPVEYHEDFNLEITTNATLMIQKWNSVSNVHDLVDYISVSIDAATKETYEVVRKPGKWEDLVSGIDLCRSLLQSGKISRLNFTFVVQENNFSEIPAFIRMAKDYGATCGFIPLLPWWQTQQQIRQRCPAMPTHPRHKEYLSVLQCEELRWQGVNATQLTGLARNRQGMFL